MICTINVFNSRANDISREWNIPSQHLSLSYLRVLLGDNPKTKAFWENIEDKINKKLSNWKYSQISKGGKLAMINSTLISLLTYQLSVFKSLNICL